MIVEEDVALAKEWLAKNCERAHIRATLLRGLAYVEAVEKAGLCVEDVHGDDLHAFLADAAESPAYQKHFVQANL